MAAAGPPQVGVPVNKAALDAKIGSNAQALKKASTVALADLNEWAAAYTAEQLVDAYGFTLEEANLFKSACRRGADHHRRRGRPPCLVEDMGSRGVRPRGPAPGGRPAGRARPPRPR